MDHGYSCCFTGHREIRTEHYDRLYTVMNDLLERLIDQNITVFRTGGALGFDTMVARQVIEKKERYPHIKLHLFLPCRDQASRWSEYDRRIYDYIKENADQVIYTSEMYTKGCMYLRDRRLVEGAQFCVAYCNKSTGGTAYTLNYAKKMGLRTVNIISML